MANSVLDLLRELARGRVAAEQEWRQAIVEIMSKPPRDRGASTYELAEAAALSRQQLHQIFRDETGRYAEPDTVGEQ